MGDKARVLVIGVVSLIIGAAGGWWYGMMQVDEVTLKLMATTQEKDQALQSADRLRRMNDDAAKKYGKDLGKLVMAVAIPAPPAGAPAQGQPVPVPAAAALFADDPAKLIDAARAILAARDGFRASLDGARGSMNSEFDVLAAELGNAAPDPEKLKQTLQLLKQNWPQKENGMEAATRKLMADLGLLPVVKPAAAPAPAAAPSPAPPPAAAPAPEPKPAEKK